MIPAEVLKSVRRIEIKTKSIIDSMMGGEYRTVFKGNGMEFAEVRHYEEGDDIRSIDWNVSARTGETFVKRNMEERELTVMLVIDVSASGDFGTSNQTKNELTAELGALLAFSAIRNNDQVGLLLFSDQIEKYIPPKKGRNHVLHLIRELLYFEPKGKGTDIAGALAHLNMIQKKKSVTFLISDFRDSGYERPLTISARRHDLIAISTDDARESELPKVGLMELYDQESGETVLVDTNNRKFREAFANKEKLRFEQREAIFKKSRIDLLTVTTEEGYLEPLIRFFKMREKRR